MSDPDVTPDPLTEEMPGKRPEADNLWLCKALKSGDAAVTAAFGIAIVIVFAFAMRDPRSRKLLEELVKDAKS